MALRKIALNGNPKHLTINSCIVLSNVRCQMSNVIIIVGLGNPGEEFEGTPHNAGFETINKLIVGIKNQELRNTEKSEKYASVWETKINKNEIIFVKPLLYMNKSGEALRHILKTYNLTTAPVAGKDAGQAPTNYSLIVVHDDADLPMGSIRLSYNSGSAGHKGVEDIIRALKTRGFYRFRIGTMPTVKRPRKRPKTTMNKLVTKKLTGINKQKMEKTVNLCAQLIQDAVIEGIIDTGRRNYVI